MTCPRRVAATLLVLLAGFSAAAAQPEWRPPRLLVLVVVDQMRADYVDRYRAQWRAGLHRVLREGAWFRQAAYPYLGTLTCAGHATIGTGALPSTHGLVQNAWWDRETGRYVACTDDPDAPAIGHGGPASGGHSARRLLVPTLAEQVRAQLPGARVVTLSLKARSAIMLAGRRADGVVWFDDRGVWATSTAYARGPLPWVDAFVKAHPVERDGGRVWTRALDPHQYLFEDDGVGERPQHGWRTTFPHELGPANQPEFYQRWTDTPFADEYLAELALAAVEQLGLGRGPSTDLLGVSFSVLDLVGHDFGPQSHEVQDVLVRLDATLGRLLDGLDRLVGAGEYVLALSADHGVSPIPERSLRDGLDAGRVDLRDLGARVDRALAPFFGEGRYVAAVNYTDLYFAPGIYDRILRTPGALGAVLDAVRQTPGVWKAFDRDELARLGASADPVARSAAASYFPGRSGDLILVPRPYWITAAAAATHGTSHGYDARVPVILFGRGIAPGEYLQPASPADIAPTLAFLAGVTLAQADGRVLTEALAPSPARPRPTAGARARPGGH